MEFESILDLKKVPEREGGRPAFFLDLNLNRIIESICALWKKDVSRFYYYLPESIDAERYRREIYADIKSGEVYEICCEFVKEMTAWEKAHSKGGIVRSEQQRAAWFITEVQVYCEAFTGLYQKLQAMTLQSRGMCALREYLQSYLASPAFCGLQEGMKQLQECMEGLHFQIIYENERMSVVRKDSESVGAYDAFLHRAFPTRETAMRTLFEITSDNSELELELLKLIRKLRPDFFKRTKAFYDKYSEYAEETLLRFVQEIEFYLSFRCFALSMQERGYVFAAPRACETVEQTGGVDVRTKQSQAHMQATGLYDLALACAKVKSRVGKGGEVESAGDEVVANDMCYLPTEHFFVLTGPNQGGKTTFARSLGQLVYFTKLGLDVPARSATVPYFNDILTHFSVEESVETGRGKLKEELVRLEPMMDQSCENAFVIINELFTTAANYDACIMGKRVLEHFLEQNCFGIYVTHLKELAEETQGIVSLRAMLDDTGRQTFEIKRGAGIGGANAGNQVNKYQLTYEQLKERLR